MDIVRMWLESWDAEVMEVGFEKQFNTEHPQDRWDERNFYGYVQGCWYDIYWEKHPKGKSVYRGTIDVGQTTVHISKVATQEELVGELSRAILSF